MSDRMVRACSRLCIALLIAGAIPLLVAAFYNHPCNDDYTFGLLTKAAWDQTHSLWEVLKAAVEQARITWGNWQGTWAAVVVFALQPAIFGESWYAISTFLLLGALIASVFYFFHSLLRGLSQPGARASRDLVNVISGVICLVLVQMIPSPVQGFYWWNGASYYVLFFALMLVEVVQLVRILSGQAGKVRVALAALIGCVIAGGNFITALLNAELTVAAFLFALVKKKRGRVALSVVLTAMLAGFIPSILAPGNAVRQAAVGGGLDPLRAIVYSFRQAYQYLDTWFTPLSLCVALMLIPFLCLVPVEKMVPRRLPVLWLLALVFCFFASAFTPQLFGMGLGWAELRVVNVWFFLFWILLLLVLLAVIQSIRLGALGGRWVTDVPRKIRQFTAAAAACACVCVALTAVLNRSEEPYAGISALKSLLTGEAQAYHDTHLQRLRIMSGPQETVELPALPCEPHVLFMDDIRENPDSWINEDYAAYYGKSAVWTAGGLSDTDLP